MSVFVLFVALAWAVEFARKKSAAMTGRRSALFNVAAALVGFIAAGIGGE